MNIEKMVIERLRSKSDFYKYVLHGYEHLLLVNRSKIYEIYKLSTTCL